MQWYQEDEYEDEEEDLMFSPALLARRASESWIVAPPIEVFLSFHSMYIFFEPTTKNSVANNQIPKFN